jgi:hypothetical protein
MAAICEMYDGQCAYCNKRGAALKCGECRSVVYCAQRSCQKAHWRIHKTICLDLRPFRTVMERGTRGKVVGSRVGKKRTKTLNVIGPPMSLHPDEANQVALKRCASPDGSVDPLPPGQFRLLYVAIAHITKGALIVQLGYHADTPDGHCRITLACKCECGQNPCRAIVPANIAQVMSMSFLRSMETDLVAASRSLPRGWGFFGSECDCRCYASGIHMTMDSFMKNF